MKLIINTTNIREIGGGFQVGISVINECINFPENEYHVFLCENMRKQINIEKFSPNFKFYTFDISPSLSYRGLRTIYKLKKIESEISPDCVFSVFGPTYWTPKSTHLMGYAIPHFIYKDSPFFSIVDVKEKLKYLFLSYAKRFFLRMNSEFYHVETEDVKKRLVDFLGCAPENVFIVSNTYNASYDKSLEKRDNILLQKNINEFRILCLSAYYSHKNLEILVEVLSELSKKGYDNVKFVLTIETDIFQKKFLQKNGNQIINVGFQNVDVCPQLYSECDAVILPTLLECFSANYPEAMKMQKPILTSNLSFAHQICGDAALYFNPLDAKEISEKIIRLYESDTLKEKLINLGNERLKIFPNSTERFKSYLQICKQICTIYIILQEYYV